MRRVEHLIKQVRRETENEVFSTSDGIIDHEIVEYFNDAQEYLVDEIHKTSASLFVKEYRFNSTSGVEGYSLPFDIYSNTNVTALHFSSNAANPNASFYEVKKASFKERDTVSGFPDKYMIKRNEILVNSIPQVNGVFRMMYNPRLPKVDIRRGKISAITTDASGVTAMTVTAETPDFTTAYFDENDAVTIVDIDGNIKTRNVKYDSVNGSGVFSGLRAAVHIDDTDLPAVDDYVVLGDYSTTHSELPEVGEKFMRAYVAWKLLYRDSSTDANTKSAELSEMAKGVVDSITLGSGDTDEVVILDSTWFM